MQVEDNNSEIFEILNSTLNELNKLNNNTEKVLAIFQIKALSSSGFKPHLESCVICSRPLDLITRFSNAHGGLLCSNCAHKDKQSRSIFRGTIATILHIQRNDWEKLLNLGLHPQVKQELKIILSNFIEFHLERKLKTERVIHQLSSFDKEVVRL
jgi:DNA repair protein RecO (recombination protein O)